MLKLIIPAATVIGFMYVAGQSATYTGIYNTPLTGWHPVKATAPFPGPVGSPIVLQEVQAAPKPKPKEYIKMANGRIELTTNMTDEEIAYNLSQVFNQ